ncbi:MAG: hypothetical protein M1479_06515 [Actinobacteria bacterium]|nr:hypothetical protein [Cyanobacteriota bacterium]MCL5771909.1 hypothetical protein [Actinomycetota bacterium]
MIRNFWKENDKSKFKFSAGLCDVHEGVNTFGHRILLQITLAKKLFSQCI